MAKRSTRPSPPQADELARTLAAARLRALLREQERRTRRLGAGA